MYGWWSRDRKHREWRKKGEGGTMDLQTGVEFSWVGRWRGFGGLGRARAFVVWWETLGDLRSCYGGGVAVQWVEAWAVFVVCSFGAFRPRPGPGGAKWSPGRWGAEDVGGGGAHGATGGWIRQRARRGVAEKRGAERGTGVGGFAAILTTASTANGRSWRFSENSLKGIFLAPQWVAG